MIPTVELTRGTNGKMATEWYYQIMNDVVGPLSGRQLLDKVRAGQVKEDTLIRKDDSQWVPARQVNGLLEAVAATADAAHLSVLWSDGGSAPVHLSRLQSQAGAVVQLAADHDGQGQDEGAEDRPGPRGGSAGHSRNARIGRRSCAICCCWSLWVGLLVVAPYLIYLATTGKLIFAGDLAIVSVLVVSALVGGVYYLISRASA